MFTTLFRPFALLLCVLLACHGDDRATAPEFFVFDNGVGRGSWTPDQQAKTLKTLGFDGISYNFTTLDDLASWQRVFKREGLKIYGLYVHSFPDRAQKPYDTALKDAIRMLGGTETVVWLTLREGKDRTNNLDDACVRIVREIADFAAPCGVRVALYGHKGFYVETGADALRIARLVNRPNVGPSINLCHEFLAGKGAVLDDTISRVGPSALLASVNGVDVAGRKYIQRLDQGDFDLVGYLRKLRSAGYRGPVGLQCYGVTGDVEENLAADIAAWRKIAAQLP